MSSISVMRTYLLIICVTIFPVRCNFPILGPQPVLQCPQVATLIKDRFHNTVESMCGTEEKSNVWKYSRPDPILCSAIYYLSHELCDKEIKRSRMLDAVKRAESRICDDYKEMRLSNDEIIPNYNKLFTNSKTCEKVCTDFQGEPHPLCVVLLYANYLLIPDEVAQLTEQVPANEIVPSMANKTSQPLSNGRMLSGADPKSHDGSHLPPEIINTSVLQEKKLKHGTKEQSNLKTNNLDSKLLPSDETAAAVVNENEIYINTSREKDLFVPNQILQPQNEPTNVGAPSAPVLSDNVNNNNASEKVPNQTGTKTGENIVAAEKGKTDQHIQKYDGGKTVESGKNSSGNLDHQEHTSSSLKDHKTTEQLESNHTVAEGQPKSQSTKKVADRDSPESKGKQPLSDQKTSGQLNDSQVIYNSQSSEIVHGVKTGNTEGQNNTLSSPKPYVNAHSVSMTSMDDFPVSKEHYTDNTEGDFAELDTRYPVDGELSDFFTGGGTGVDDDRPAGSFDRGGGSGVDGPRPASDVLDNVKAGMVPGTPVLNDNYKYEAEESHFFAYFMTTMIFCIVGYLIFHNKQKILALALEGRARRGRRRPNTSGYRKLDSNLEEAIGSSKSSSVTQIIY